MGRKRGKDQILHRILEVCAGGGATKTQIVYFSSLNFHTVVTYLELVTRNGLVVRAAGGVPRYRATAKRFEGTSAFREREEIVRLP